MSTNFWKQKVCWYQQQCFSLLPQENFPTNNLNFHWRWSWWDRCRLLKSFLLYHFLVVICFFQKHSCSLEISCWIQWARHNLRKLSGSFQGKQFDFLKIHPVMKVFLCKKNILDLLYVSLMMPYLSFPLQSLYFPKVIKLKNKDVKYTNGSTTTT